VLFRSITRFPPTDGTVVPLFDMPSSSYDLHTDFHISLEEATEFWSSPASRQNNGMWKGGSWGLDNLLPHSKWCTQAWIGDTITLDFVKNGIIKFEMGTPGFNHENSILPNTINSAWSLDITIDKTGQKCAGYGMEYFMPQYANDLLFVWKDPKSGKRLVKVCKRGNAATVDMQNKLMPGAGEHLEPGEALKFKASLTRAFHEELGVMDSALAQCYVLDLGKFDDPGRDPRYWTFFHNEKTFGMKRYSSTHGFVLYFHGDAPLLRVPDDVIEIAQLGPFEKRWMDLDTLDVTSEAWMIEDHAKIVRSAKACLSSFDLENEETKQQFVYKIDEPNNMVCYVYESMPPLAKRESSLFD